MNVDDPTPAKERRKMLTIYIGPSVKAEVDRLRGKLTVSEWIERAILIYAEQQKGKAGG
jgi:hypothetical protein